MRGRQVPKGAMEKIKEVLTLFLEAVFFAVLSFADKNIH
jgi:hypothetical protein